MTTDQYIESINGRYRLGNTTEHSFRGDLQNLIESLVPTIKATNEPKRQSCGAPDYIITKKDIPVGFIEAKDIGDKDLEGQKKTGNKEQFDRYRASLDNLIFTDYINFNFYQDGTLVTRIAIGEQTEKGITPLPNNFLSFENLIKEFCTHVGNTIKSPKRLAEMMAGKARLLSDVIEKALTSDEENEANSTLKEQMEGFKLVLIHDIKPKNFADVYAQTIAYGLFAARLHDSTLPTFSRQEAAELIPRSNPFLRKLFGYIAGPDIDDRIKWIVDNLVEVFLHCNVEDILQNYGKSTRTEDPIIHFYETFLSEYDPKLRKARGVWYTPAPVVNFIVRAVNDILKSDFLLSNGIADSSKTKIKVKVPGDKGKDKIIEREVHKVQILDPATGTGTFLAETINQTKEQFKGQEGIWTNYVENHLIPRLNGFEILMASYAMAHLKINLLLKETNFFLANSQRLKIYLTNSLEEYHSDTGTLFANWLSAEANEANQIKRDTPVMCVIGNPPYSGESINKGDWIMKLMEDYKKEPGGIIKLNEKNPKWINDDYVKFIRFGQYFIEKNGSGILAYINPHGFLMNPTFRGMRWNLLKTFDKIYIIDLHGNSNKIETNPDGTQDMNVFDIQQGVAINIFIKTGKKKLNNLSRVYHTDLYGKREAKYSFLLENSLKDIPFTEINCIPPAYFFTNRDKAIEEEYNKGFSINNVFLISSVGIVTARDNFSVHHNLENVKETIERFLKTPDEEARKVFNLGKDVRDWKVSYARQDLMNTYPKKGSFSRISYRPFDDRWTYYTGKSKGFHCYPRQDVMKHFVNHDNIGLVTARSNKSETCDHFFVTKYIMEAKFGERTTQSAVFPLFVYSNTNNKDLFQSSNERRTNLDEEFKKDFSQRLGVTFSHEPKEEKNTISSIDLFDYIYSVLHSPSYRRKFHDFLKVDFPKIPFPKDLSSFFALASLGSVLRKIHLFESAVISDFSTKYPVPGHNKVTKTKYIGKKLYINQNQYFDNVSEEAWNFYIGGYQPAQKWLKDRVETTLSYDDIIHYQKMIVALNETKRIMKEIDDLEII